MVASKYVSTAQAHFSTAVKGDSEVKDLKEAKTVQGSSAKVNFSIGEVATKRTYYETTTAIAQNPDQYKDAKRIIVDVPNLRSANFHLGNEKVNYQTTAKASQAESSNTKEP